MIEAFAQNLSRAVFDFADVNQHSRRWIDRPAENKIGDVIAAAAKPRVRFRAERGQVFIFAPIINMQTPRRGEFETFADGQEHLANHCSRSLRDGIYTRGVRRVERPTPNLSAARGI